MIIWLASYPKSGNTLLRSILASYLFSNDGNLKSLLIIKLSMMVGRANIPIITGIKEIPCCNATVLKLYLGVAVIGSRPIVAIIKPKHILI